MEPELGPVAGTAGTRRAVITLDTSAILTLIDSYARRHARTLAALQSDPGPYIVPVGILSEITYLIATRWGQGAIVAFLGDVEEGAYTLDCGDRDLSRIQALVQRYANLPLGYADAAVIACAERSGGRILTLDRRDFDIVARDVSLTLLP